eukprot:GEMP01000733.1.p1 GENE.GEMP01000733.1~~GEMP01000733.1.p1  ORF type:complete len:1611 (+),score=442.02 GEMP01000733.1:1-4833(+)
MTEEGNAAGKDVHAKERGGKTMRDAMDNDKKKENVEVEVDGQGRQESTPQSKEAQPTIIRGEKRAIRKTEMHRGSNFLSEPPQEHDLSPNKKYDLSERCPEMCSGAWSCVGESRAELMTTRGLIAHIDGMKPTVPQWTSAVVEMISLAPGIQVPAAPIAAVMKCATPIAAMAQDSIPTDDADTMEREMIHRGSIETTQMTISPAAHLCGLEEIQIEATGSHGIPCADARRVCYSSVETRSAPSQPFSSSPPIEKATAPVEPPALLTEAPSVATETFTAPAPVTDALPLLSTACSTPSLAHRAPTEANDDQPISAPSTDKTTTFAAVHRSVLESQTKPAVSKGASVAEEQRAEDITLPDAANTSFEVDRVTTPSSAWEPARMCTMFAEALGVSTETYSASEETLRPGDASRAPTITPTNGLQSQMTQGRTCDDTPARPPSPPPEITIGSPNCHPPSPHSPGSAASSPRGRNGRMLGTTVAPPPEVTPTTKSPTPAIRHGPSISNIQSANTRKVVHHCSEPNDATVSAFIGSTLTTLLGPDAPCAYTSCGSRERMSFRRKPSCRGDHNYYTNDDCLLAEHYGSTANDECDGGNRLRASKAVGTQSQDGSARALERDMLLNRAHELAVQRSHDAPPPQLDTVAGRATAVHGQASTEGVLARLACSKNGRNNSPVARKEPVVMRRPVSAPVLQKEIHQKPPLHYAPGTQHQFWRSTMSSTAHSVRYQNPHSPLPNDRRRAPQAGALPTVYSRPQSRGNQQRSVRRQMPLGGTPTRPVRCQSAKNSFDRAPSEAPSAQQRSPNERRPQQQQQYVQQDEEYRGELQKQQRQGQERGRPVYAEVAQMRADVDVLAADMTALRDTMVRLRSEEATLRDELVGLDRDILPLRACSVEKKNEKQALETVFQELEQDNTQLRARISQGKDEKHALCTVLNALEEGNSGLRSAIVQQEEKGSLGSTFCTLHGAAPDLDSATSWEECRAEEAQARDEVEKAAELVAATCAVQAHCDNEKRLLELRKRIEADERYDALLCTPTDATAICGPQLDVHSATRVSTDPPLALLDGDERAGGGVLPPYELLAIKDGTLEDPAHAPTVVKAAEERSIVVPAETPSALYPSSLTRHRADTGTKPNFPANFRVPSLRPKPDPVAELRLARTEEAHDDLATTAPSSALLQPLQRQESAYFYRAGPDDRSTRALTVIKKGDTVAVTPSTTSRVPLGSVKDDRATVSCVPTSINKGDTVAMTVKDSTTRVFPTMVVKNDISARHEGTTTRQRKNTDDSGASSLTRAGGSGDASASNHGDDTPRSRRSSSSRSVPPWARHAAHRTAECMRHAAHGVERAERYCANGGADTRAEGEAGENTVSWGRSQRDASEHSNITYGMPGKSMHVDANGAVWQLLTSDQKAAGGSLPSSAMAQSGASRSAVSSNSAAWSDHKGRAPQRNMAVEPRPSNQPTHTRSSNVRTKIEAALALSVNLETRRKQRRDPEESEQEPEVQIQELTACKDTRPTSTRESRCREFRIADLNVPRPSRAGASSGQPLRPLALRPISAPQQRSQELHLHGYKNGPTTSARGLPDVRDSTAMRAAEYEQQSTDRWPPELQVDWPHLVLLASGQVQR